MKPIITRDRFGRLVAIGPAHWLALALCVALWIGALVALAMVGR